MHRPTRMTERMRHMIDMLQKAICRGSLGSHQNSVEGG